MRFDPEGKAVRLGLAAMAASALVLGAASAASAEVLVSIPVDGVVYGAKGESILVATAAVPADYVGETCLVLASTQNQESVHPNNDLIIVNGDETIVIPNVEGEADIATNAGSFETIAPNIEVYIRLGADGVSSGGFELNVDCTVQPPTVPPTTPPTTPPTVEPQGPTTAPPPQGPTVNPAPPTPTLPVTGSSTALIASLGVGLVGLGVVLRNRASVAAKRQ